MNSSSSSCSNTTTTTPFMPPPTTTSIESTTATTYLAIAALLSLERLFYGMVWKRPNLIKKMASSLSYSSREPEMILGMVKFFKLIQAIAFAWWYLEAFGPSLVIPEMDPATFTASSLLLMAGQVLNLSVWAKIGIDGVCYGCKFEREVEWCRSFPYSLMSHPQYTGCIMTVWGLFLPFRSTEGAGARNWFAIPVMETGLYMTSMGFLER